MKFPTAIKFDMTSPCASCPYRRSAPPWFWAKEEFETLLHHDRIPMPGAIYACHGSGKLPEAHVCAGWLLDQRNHGYPSIALRLRFLNDPAAIDCAEKITCDEPVYDSVEEMIAYNYPQLLLQAEKARKAP